MRKVQLRNGFSDRNKIQEENKIIQYKNLDSRTRVAIINDFNIVFEWLEKKYKRSNSDSEKLQHLIYLFYRDVYCIEIGSYNICEYHHFFSDLRETLREDTYDQVFTVIEYFVDKFDKIFLENDQDILREILNKTFEEEYVGYRFVGDKIIKITDSIEIDAIEETLNCDFNVVREHIDKSLEFLSNRDKPDYENSIKESMTAVESICSIITGINGKDASLGKLLGHLENQGVIIDGGMRAAFNSLYGYTSNANGVRHAGDIGGPKSTFEEAKFMLVSCCAFINYLIALKAKID